MRNLSPLAHAHQCQFGHTSSLNGLHHFLGDRIDSLSLLFLGHFLPQGRLTPGENGQQSDYLRWPSHEGLGHRRGMRMRKELDGGANCLFICVRVSLSDEREGLRKSKRAEMESFSYEDQIFMEMSRKMSRFIGGLWGIISQQCHLYGPFFKFYSRNFSNCAKL